MDLHELLRKHDELNPPEEGAPAWYVSFADMATLLMATFLMLLSFATMDLKKFNKVLGSVQTAFGVAKSSEPPPAPGLPTQAPLTAPSGDKALSVIQAVFQELGPMAEVFQGEDGVTVRFEGKVLFLSGSAEFRPEAAQVLDRLVYLLRKYTFDLYILGHTDSIPIETSRFPSNWELSGARAAAALRYLSERGADPLRLVAVGFADSRPIAPNDTPEDRARNRRVEFLFKNPEGLPAGGFKPARP